MLKNTPKTLDPAPEAENLNPKQKRSLHRIVWQYVRSTVYFWLPAIVFLAVANEVREDEPLTGDVAVLTQVHSIASPFMTDLFVVITTLGSAPVIVAGVAIAAATMWYLKRRRDALFLLFAAGGTSAINIVFKLLFERERPDLWQHLVVEEGFSFPSGHAMISSALALAVIMLVWHTRYRWAAIIIGILYALLVGISRLYLGVHFPSDVVAGWCVSVLWIITLHHVITRYQSRRNLNNLAK